MKAHITRFTFVVALGLAVSGASYAQAGNYWIGEAAGYQGPVMKNTATVGQGSPDIRRYWVSEAEGYRSGSATVQSTTVANRGHVDATEHWVGDAGGYNAKHAEENGEHLGS